MRNDSIFDREADVVCQVQETAAGPEMLSPCPLSFVCVFFQPTPDIQTIRVRQIINH